MTPVAIYNQKIQEKILEIETVIEAKELNLQIIQDQLDIIHYMPLQYIEQTRISLRNQKEFISNSIKILKHQALVLHNMKILCY